MNWFRFLSYLTFTNWNIYLSYVKMKKFIFKHPKFDYKNEKILGINSNLFSFPFPVSKYSYSFSFWNLDSFYRWLWISTLFTKWKNIRFFLNNNKKSQKVSGEKYKRINQDVWQNILNNLQKIIEQAKQLSKFLSSHSPMNYNPLINKYYTSQ